MPHHPRACSPRFFVPEAHRLDNVAGLSLERCEGGPAGRHHAGLTTQPASAVKIGDSGQFEARNYPERGGPALPSPLVVSRPLSSLVLPEQFENSRCKSIVVTDRMVVGYPGAGGTAIALRGAESSSGNLYSISMRSPPNLHTPSG